MVGNARGIFTCHRVCRFVEPWDWAVSITCEGTSFIPSEVIRITGGRAYTKVAIIPTNGPMPHSIMTGMRYTNMGMVCMVSRMGRRMDSKVRFCEATTPRAIPTTTVMTPAVRTWPKVFIVMSHTPPMPTKASPTTARRDTFQPAVR